MDYFSAIIGSGFVFLMLLIIHVRRRLIKHPYEEASAVLDSGAGLLILLVGVLSLFYMNLVAGNVKGDMYEASSYLVKALAGIIGGMYLKQGYDKHDKDWLQKQKSALASGSVENEN